MSTLAEPSPETDFTCSGDDAVVLVAANGDRFRVARASLINGSSFFRTMLSLPQSPSPSKAEPTDTDPIIMSEDAEVVAFLCKHMSALALPSLGSLDQVDKLLRAADKFEMPNLLSVIHYLLRHPPEPQRHIHRHVLASRFQWDDMAGEELMASLNSPLDTIEATRCCDSSVNAPFVVPLLALRQARSDVFSSALNAMRTRVTLPFALFSTKPVLSSRTADDRDVAMYNHEAAVVFFWRLRFDFTARPGGAFIIAEEYLSWPEWAKFESTLDQPCVERLKERLRKIVESLPSDLSPSGQASGRER
ncbi:hypothetical protein BKA62DRAFT_712738 [Auriculariales sp. MPI-PUGE-AT-0066]|nr:hypothetical protein BKA62DRAFT_712738 [Auriculariales sp. MPI-PUGE-AT-0066]